jgi:hypothetical protein
MATPGFAMPGAEAPVSDEPILPGSEGGGDEAEYEPEGGDSAPDGAEVDAASDESDSRPSGPITSVDPEVGKALREINTANPKVGGKLKALVYGGIRAQRELGKLTQDFPNGVADVMALKEALDSKLGGMDGIDELGQSIQFWNDLDAKWNAGDPSLPANLAKEYPEQFAAMMPEFLKTFSQTSPEAYNKVYAGMVISELQSVNIPQAMSLLQGYLEPILNGIQDPTLRNFLERGMSIVGNINKWISDTGNAAKATPAAKANNQGEDRIKTREAELNREREQVFSESVQAPYMNFLDSTVKAELNSILKGKELSPDRMKLLTRAIMSEVGEKMQQHRKACESYFQKRDKEGYLKFARSRAGEILKGMNGKPGVVRQVYKHMFSTGLGRPAGSKTAANGANGQNGAKPVVNAGPEWTKAPKMPERNLIDWGKTSFEMRMHNKYVLKSGKKIIVSA